MDLKKEIMALIDQFTQEELGNRLSQFALLSFRMLIIQKIDAYFSSLPSEDKE